MDRRSLGRITPCSTAAVAKTERWGTQILQRPGPAGYLAARSRTGFGTSQTLSIIRSNAGGGKWKSASCPEQWAIHYGDLTFQLKPMSFKHTGLFPEQAANWDFIDNMIRNAGRPINVLNLLPTPAAQRSRRQRRRIRLPC